jgi:hypothetical protein
VSYEPEFLFFGEDAAIVKMTCRFINRKNVLGVFVIEEWLYIIGMDKPFIIRWDVISMDEKRIVSSWENPILHY